MKLGMIFAAAAACALATPVMAQETPRHLVSLYHVAPGHHVAFLKWLAGQDRASVAAGLPAGQLYAHTDGDSWDYMVIFPVTTDAQDDAVDAAAKKMGLMTGPRVGIELRQHLTSHTDTFTRGPMTAAQALTAIGEK